MVYSSYTNLGFSVYKQFVIRLSVLPERTRLQTRILQCYSLGIQLNTRSLRDYYTMWTITAKTESNAGAFLLRYNNSPQWLLCPKSLVNDAVSSRQLYN